MLGSSDRCNGIIKKSKTFNSQRMHKKSTSKNTKTSAGNDKDKPGEHTAGIIVTKSKEKYLTYSLLMDVVCPALFQWGLAALLVHLLSIFKAYLALKIYTKGMGKLNVIFLLKPGIMEDSGQSVCLTTVFKSGEADLKVHKRCNTEKSTFTSQSTWIQGDPPIRHSTK